MIPTLRQRRKDNRGNHSISSALALRLGLAVTRTLYQIARLPASDDLPMPADRFSRLLIAAKNPQQLTALPLALRIAFFFGYSIMFLYSNCRTNNDGIAAKKQYPKFLVIGNRRSVIREPAVKAQQNMRQKREASRDVPQSERESETARTVV